MQIFLFKTSSVKLKKLGYDYDSSSNQFNLRFHVL